MNKALRVPDYLRHILKAIDRIDRYTEDMDEVEFLKSDLVQDAVIRISRSLARRQTVSSGLLQNSPRNMTTFPG